MRRSKRCTRGLHGVRLVVRSRRRGPQRCVAPTPSATARPQRDVVVDVRAQQGAGRGPGGCWPCMGRAPSRTPNAGTRSGSDRAASSTVPVPSASGTKAVRWPATGQQRPATAPPGSGSAGRRAAPRPGPSRDAAESCSRPARMARVEPAARDRRPPGRPAPPRTSRVARSAVTTWTCARRHGLRHGGDRVEGEGVRQVGASDAGWRVQPALGGRAEPLTGTTIRHVALSGSLIAMIVSGRARLPRHRPRLAARMTGTRTDRHRAGAAGPCHGEGWTASAADTPGSAAAVVLPVRRGPAAAADAAADPPRLARRRAPAPRTAGSSSAPTTSPTSTRSRSPTSCTTTGTRRSSSPRRASSASPCSAGCSRTPSRSPSTAAPARRRRRSGPRWTRCTRASASPIFPEGTLTRDPDLWPMIGKTGAARIALTTGCPVIPVAQWGPQELLAPYAQAAAAPAAQDDARVAPGRRSTSATC